MFCIVSVSSQILSKELLPSLISSGRNLLAPDGFVDQIGRFVTALPPFMFHSFSIRPLSSSPSLSLSPCRQ